MGDDDSVDLSPIDMALFAVACILYLLMAGAAFVVAVWAAVRLTG